MRDKILLLLAIILGFAYTNAQDINYTFTNAQNTLDGGIMYYEVDVLIASTQDFKLGAGQIYINYNTAAFGVNINLNAKVAFTAPNDSYILGEFNLLPVYALHQLDNTNSRVSFDWIQSLSSGGMLVNNITATPTLLVHIKIAYTDANQDPMICFESDDSVVNNVTDLSSTACGPITFAIADCTSFPGIQLLNNTFNCDGADINICIPPEEPTNLECWETANFDTATCSWDVTGTQNPEPTNLECWETANFNTATCVWDITGTQATEPTNLACWETANFNTATCSWDVTGTQATEPTNLECWETANFNTATCSWDVTGTQATEPTNLACWETANFNNTTCVWDITGTQNQEPTNLECWETANFNNATCSWDVTGTQATEPTDLECWETANFNTATCSWDVTGTQDSEPTNLACWETANFNNATCVWDVTGTQDLEPTNLECWETANFNTATCSWDVTGTQPDPIVTNANICEGGFYVWAANGETYTTAQTGLTISGENCEGNQVLNLTVTNQPEEPTTACWETATFNIATCSWDVTGTQATEPTNLECWETANFNTATCTWDVTGTQATEPTNLECWETASFNNTTCTWDVTGTQDPEPTNLACWETVNFNTATCVWDVTGTQATEPTNLECWETANFNNTTCSWDVTGTQPDPIVTNENICEGGFYVWAANGETYTTEQTGLTISGENCEGDQVLNLTVTNQPEEPTTACWETATFNTATCTWDITGMQDSEPTNLECWETANFNTATCSWDVTGTQATEPTNLECWETANFNTATCVWDVTGTQATEPTNLECWETANFNTATCSWDVTGTQDSEPTNLECWETTNFNTATCSWDVTGTQATEPTNLECWETANFNNATCVWDITGTQNQEPTNLACWEIANFNTTSCVWEVTGTQAIEPTNLECWETTNFNTATCSWDITGTQVTEPTNLECWETTSFNTTTCVWDVTGTQDPEPTNLECWETANFNITTCSWDVTGTQDSEPTNLACWETVNFNNTTCVWDVTGTQAIEPTNLECWETVNFNTATCSWDVTGTQDPEPTNLACWETANFNTATCSWDVTGTQATEPTNLACWETANFNTATCVWDVTGTQNPEPTNLACWETASFNNTTCTWDVTGTQATEPTNLECWETANFNTATCSWDVTGTPNDCDGLIDCEDPDYIDSQDPTISCVGNQNKDTDTDACDYTVIGTEFDPTAFNDNCSSFTIVNSFNNSSSLNGAIFPKGSTPVTWTVTDAANNSTTCTFDVIISDNQNPTISYSFYSAVTNSCDYAAGSEFDPMFNDNCPGAMAMNNYNNSSSLSGEIFPLGETDVTWTVTDAANNSVSFGSSIYITNHGNPSISCVANQNKDTDPGACDYTAIGTEFDPMAFNDNCLIGLTIMNDYNNSSSLNGSVFPIGTTSVTWTATDAVNLITTCAFDVIVSDNQDPTIICNFYIDVFTDPGTCDYTVIGTEFAPLAFGDNCYFAYILNDYNNSISLDGSVFPKGTTSVTWTVFDAANNSTSCTFDVIVSDNQDLEVTCITDATRDTDSGSCDYTVVGTELDATFTDNCTDSSITNDYNNSDTLDGAIFQQGATVITWTADDGNGQSVSCTTSITVEDHEAPIISCSADISINATNATGAVVNYTEPLVTDNCTGATTVLTAGFTNGDTFPIGDTTVTYQVTDGSGNITDCSFTVTVNGLTPEIVCPANITVSNDAGQCAVVVNFSASDVVGIPASTITYSHQSGDLFPVGTTTVTATATNAVGIDVCTFDVIVEDNEAPVITCIANATRDTDSGSCDYTVVGTELDATFTDNCTSGTITNDYNNSTTLDGAVFQQDATVVTWTVDDGNGQSVSCTTTITIEDNEAPVITCIADATRDTDSGNCDYTVIGTELDATFTDNCSSGTITNDYNNSATLDGAIFQQDDTVVTWTVDDGNSQSVSCTTTITVVDNEAPVITCIANTTRDTDLGSCDYTVVGTELDAIFTDNCSSGSSITNDYNNSATLDGAIFLQGDTIVTWTAEDGNGQSVSCTTTITVEDNEAPIVDCLNLQILLDASGTGSISIDDINNNSTDNCEIASITISQMDFDCSDIGGDLDALIISEYIDGSGNDDCIEIFNGTGNTVDLYTGNYSLLVYENGSSTPTYSIPLLGTIADRDVYVICNPFGPGAAQADQTGGFAFDGNDAISLSRSGSAVDIIGEIGVDPGTGWNIAPNTTYGTTLVRKPTVLQGNINDVSGIGSEWTQYAQNTITHLGSHEIEITDLANNIILTVTDTSGNVSTCEGNVTVIDLIPPVASCQNVTIQLDEFGNASVAPSAVDNGSTDICGIAGLALSQTDFTCSDIGANTVTLTVTDRNGNTATCTATVTVEDLIGSVVVTQDITVQLDDNGTVSITADDIDNGSTDACGIASLSVSPDTFDCSNVGDNTVTLTVTDNNGNVTIGTATVTVEDMVSPDAICQNITVQLDATGNVSITGNDVDGGSTDACGIVSYEVSPSMFTCAEIGDNTVTLTVTDAYGNSSTCTSVVTVEGIIPTVTITQGELPEFCQGAAVVLTANSTEAISYFWNSGETTESIEVTGNGTYGVLVTSATNCETYVEYTVTGFDAGSLIAAYTIIAIETVFLHGGNLVQTGGVGAMSSSVGNIKLHQASTIVDFGQAVSFDLNQGSFIGNMIYAAANPTIPAFTYNTYSNNSSPDVTINNNQTQTLNGAVYDVVTVKQGATVIFSQSNVYINELKTFENASIEFAACANVFINDKFMLAQGGTINSNGNKVVFYVNEDVQIEKGSDVKASIHANNHEMLVKGSNGNGNNAGEPTYMTGLFIANRVHGNKNVIWNADSLCDPCPITAPGGSNRVDVASTQFSIDIDVIAWPNPSNSYFNLKLKTAIGTSDVTIEVFDVTNKLVHSNTFKYNDVYQFGSKLEGGVYIVKITQAGIEKSVRVIRY